MLIPTPAGVAAPGPASDIALDPALAPDTSTIQTPIQAASPADPMLASAGPAGASAALAPASGDVRASTQLSRTAPGDPDPGVQLTMHDEGPSPHSFGGEGSRPAAAPEGTESVNCSTGDPDAAGAVGADPQAPVRAGCGAADGGGTAAGNMTAAMASDGGDGGAGNGHLVAALLATVAVAVLCSIGGAVWFVHSRREGAETAPGIAVRQVRHTGMNSSCIQCPA